LLFFSFLCIILKFFFGRSFSLGGGNRKKERGERGNIYSITLGGVFMP